MKIIILTFIFAIFYYANCEPEVNCGRNFENLIYPSSSTFGRPGYGYSGIYTACTFKNAKSSLEIESSLATLTNKILIQKIVFTDSEFTELPENTFEKLDSLKEITASGVGMKTLTSTFLIKHGTFDVVDLSNNKITKIGGGTFNTMSVNVVDLSSNQISSIDSKAFNGSRIQKLNLEDNLIKDIQFVENFVFFKTLDLSRNSLVEIKSIDSDKWTSIPSRMTSDNLFVHLLLTSDSTILFNGNKNLRSFDCKSSISFALIGLEENPNLTEMKLNNCSIKTLHLSGSGNNLKNVQLNDKIETLVAMNTKLTNLDLKNAKSLTALTLSNTSLTPEVINATLQIESLEELDLSYNYIGPLNIPTFAKLKNLKTLNLRATSISNITFGSFSHQDKVESLNVADNQLYEFDMNMIYSLTSLIRLDISGNELQELTNFKYAHQQFTLLRHIDVTHNNFTCKYLMTLVKIFRTYQISMLKSRIEEHGWNIQGIRCAHVPDDGLDPLPESSDNSTGYLASEVGEKINSMSEVLRTFSIRLQKLEAIGSQQIPSADKLVSSSSLQVQNSKLMESSLIIVCICFTVFMGKEIFLFVKRNFIDSRNRRSRAMSEHTLNIVEDY